MKYKTKTEPAIKQALIDLLQTKPLADITVSELAESAKISRSTFYQHYGNSVDVYDSLVADLGGQTSSMLEQIACSSSIGSSRHPFCALIREGGQFGALAAEDRFLSTFLAPREDGFKHDLHDVLVRAGYTDQEASALCAFQLSGCFSAARSVDMSAEEWEGVRAVIDRFILGGISACLAAKAAGK